MNVYTFVLWVGLSIGFYYMHGLACEYELRLFDAPQEWRFASPLFTDTSGRFRLMVELRIEA